MSVEHISLANNAKDSAVTELMDCSACSEAFQKIDWNNIAHARIQKECQRVSISEMCFSIDEGRWFPNTTLSGPSSARQRNAI